VATHAIDVSGDGPGSGRASSATESVPAKADTRFENRARRYDPAETRQRVLAAANMLFATKGYGATGTADIAREADVSEGSIFYHFGSKRNLLSDIGRMYGERMIEAMSQGDPLEDLEPGIIIGRAFDYALQHNDWEKFTEVGCDPVKKPVNMHSAEAEPFYLASRDVVVAWTTKQHEMAYAKHGGPKMDIPMACALTYALVGNAMEAIKSTQDEAARAVIIAETKRFVRAAYGYDANGKLLACI
jgi:AcrR family transcriptional regulator